MRAPTNAVTRSEVNMIPNQWERRAHRLLGERGAADIQHPGGTLLEHLRRVRTVLRGWGAPTELQAAGLCHACYGTDGLAVSLLSLQERPLLRRIIGTESESQVYRYASCDRSAVYPRLASSDPLAFTDRFTRTTSSIAEVEAANFVELTAANELDIVRANPQAGSEWAPGLFELLSASPGRLSTGALTAWKEMLHPSELRTGTDS